MPISNLALILDTETTGNVSTDQPNASELIEIGMVMLDVPSLESLGEFSIVIEPTQEQFTAMYKKDVVRKMHEENGLIKDLLDGKGVTPAEADIKIGEWLDTFSRLYSHIPYGGSGVSHFDRQYINAQLPRLARRITFWSLDVGAARRIFALQGAHTASIEAKTHRALDDARVHAEELRFYAEAGRYADHWRNVIERDAMEAGEYAVENSR